MFFAETKKGLAKLRNYSYWSFVLSYQVFSIGLTGQHGSDNVFTGIVSYGVSARVVPRDESV